ncbi:MAG: sulfite exporter TauE/SafE family protein [Ignavibacteria bacterium]|nr:sulfite exporter TauE/SafE family protein [Ignavibacteria bacterium]
MQQITILLIIGLAAGIISGFLGIGGGIIIIPALVGLLGFTQQTAQGTSLALLLPPIGILAVMNYYNKGYVDLKAAGIMCITFVVGSYISSKLAVVISQEVLKKAFSLFLFLYAMKLWFGK